MRTPLIHFALATLFIGTVCARGSDWPQFRGPTHDGSSPEKILETWPASGLAEIWKVPLTDGFSSFAVADGKAFTLVTREVEGANQEVCVALDAKTGKELWAMPLGIAKYDGGGGSGASGNDGGDGPRSTPSYNHGKVYTYSSRMVLNCFDAETGKLAWSVDMIKEHNGRNIHWENAASPLIEGDLVYVAGGGSSEALIAFNKNDGKVVWKGENDGLTQSTPIAATIQGDRQVIFFTQTGLVSVEPKTGSVLWRFPFQFKTSTAISPVVSGDIVYCSAAYGVGAGACRISKADGKFTATELWKQRANVIQSHWATPVCHDGYLYGLFGQAKFAKAPLECVEMSTGKVLWSQEGFGPGGLTLVDGHVMVLSDAGDLVMVKATPDAYTETARSHILAGKCWNVAAISDGEVFARSTKEGVCLKVAP
ncbi:MAG TPA: PQQ-binding-like beta-propeller repeat protein [Verrucomicrobiae bacterium]|jgi:outer membrane protein assembly factor BamB|nr:PQQ-binding-like beta-propeller repeat protein [Verrucomicrobiae bacterium]